MYSSGGVARRTNPELGEQQCRAGHRHALQEERGATPMKRSMSSICACSIGTPA
jgi:hypothetical protein